MIARGSRKENLCGRLTYERLPLFCYVCGLIGHTKIECEVAEAKDSSDGVKQYGEWLKAKVDGKNSGNKISNIQRREVFTFGNQNVQRIIDQPSSEGSIETLSLAQVDIISKENYAGNSSYSIRNPGKISDGPRRVRPSADKKVDFQSSKNGKSIVIMGDVLTGS